LGRIVGWLNASDRSVGLLLRFGIEEVEGFSSGRGAMPAPVHGRIAAGMSRTAVHFEFVRERVIGVR